MCEIQIEKWPSIFNWWLTGEYQNYPVAPTECHKFFKTKYCNHLFVSDFVVQSCRAHSVLETYFYLPNSLWEWSSAFFGSTLDGDHRFCCSWLEVTLINISVVSYWLSKASVSLGGKVPIYIEYIYCCVISLLFPLNIFAQKMTSSKICVPPNPSLRKP